MKEDRAERWDIREQWKRERVHAVANVAADQAVSCKT